jgi:hypothetical protein
MPRFTATHIFSLRAKAKSASKSIHMKIRISKHKYILSPDAPQLCGSKQRPRLLLGYRPRTYSLI